MAAPTVRSVTTLGVAGPGTSTISVTTPSDTAVGDLLVIFLSNDYYTASGLGLNSVSPSATATEVTAAACDAGSNNPHIKVWTAPVTTAGAATVTVHTGHTDEEQALCVFVIAGGASSADTGTSTFTTGNTTTWTCSALTTSVADCLVLAHWQGNSLTGGKNLTAPSGWTTQYDDLAEGSFATCEGASQTFASSGSTGTFAASCNNPGRGYGVSAVAIAPGGPTTVNGTASLSAQSSLTAAGTPVRIGASALTSQSTVIAAALVTTFGVPPQRSRTLPLLHPGLFSYMDLLTLVLSLIWSLPGKLR